jgi:hypothetical protein
MSLRIALAVSLVSLVSFCFACGARTELDGLDSDGGGGSGGTKKQPESCKEQGITYIYVVLEDKRLFAFDPRDATFSPRGALDCMATINAYSMAVDRKGVALVELEGDPDQGGGQVLRVDTKDGTCTPTSYVPDPTFKAFGMGYAANTEDDGETLYLASDTGSLARLDPKTLERTEIGPFSKPIGKAELTGTGDGRLFGFGVETSESHLSEISPDTAKVLRDRLLPIGANFTDWAFANWGSDFYFFTSTSMAPGSVSIVTKYDPTAHTLKRVATAPGLIVGSGVSTCAPL